MLKVQKVKGTVKNQSRNREILNIRNKLITPEAAMVSQC